MNEILKQFIKDRDEALLSMDKDKILAYMRKYDCPIPPTYLFWTVVHQCRANCNSLPEEERNKSIEWLKAKGMSTKAKGLELWNDIRL